MEFHITQITRDPIILEIHTHARLNVVSKENIIIANVRNTRVTMMMMLMFVSARKRKKMTDATLSEEIDSTMMKENLIQKTDASSEERDVHSEKKEI